MTPTIDQLRSVASDAHAKLATLRADHERAEAIRADLMTDADPDEIDDIIALDEAVVLATRKVELQQQIVQRADQAVADAERAAAIDAATQAHEAALSDYLKVLLRAHAALKELDASRTALMTLATEINNARRIIGHKERFVQAYIPPVQPHVVSNIESAADDVYARLGAPENPTGNQSDVAAE